MRQTTIPLAALCLIASAAPLRADKNLIRYIGERNARAVEERGKNSKYAKSHAEFIRNIHRIEAGKNNSSDQDYDQSEDYERMMQDRIENREEQIRRLKAQIRRENREEQIRRLKAQIRRETKEYIDETTRKLRKGEDNVSLFLDRSGKKETPIPWKYFLRDQTIMLSGRLSEYKGREKSKRRARAEILYSTADGRDKRYEFHLDVDENGDFYRPLYPEKINKEIKRGRVVIYVDALGETWTRSSCAFHVLRRANR